MFKPVVNGRASICNWSLEFSFRTRQQVVKFIDLLLKDEIDFHFEYEYIMTDKDYLYTVRIHDMSWADNLQRVAGYLKEVDYSDV